MIIVILVHARETELKLLKIQEFVHVQVVLMNHLKKNAHLVLNNVKNVILMMSVLHVLEKEHHHQIAQFHHQHLNPLKLKMYQLDQPNLLLVLINVKPVQKCHLIVTFVVQTELNPLPQHAHVTPDFMKKMEYVKNVHTIV